MFNIKKIDLKVHKLVDSLFVWNYKTAFKWRGLQFSDYRQYDIWDDSKYIDFIASAREQKLLIKRFEEERELSVFFLIDLSESMNFLYNDKKKIDSLIETFYILSYSAILNNDKIGALVFNENWFFLIKPTKWKKSLLKILDIINPSPLAPLIKSEGNKIKTIKNFDVNKMIAFFNNLPIKNALIFLLSDKIDEINDKNLKIISIKNDFVYINIFDHFENNLSKESYTLKLWNTIKTIFLNLRDEKKVLEYKNLRKQKINNFKKKLNNYNIDYLLIDDKTNIFKELLKFFKSR